MKKKILVVDDEKDIREIMKITFEQDGFDVIEAYNGKTAIQLAQKEKPDLITLDVMMPDMDGFQVAKRLKENPETANIPIVIVSLVPQNKDQFVQGIRDYISKPFKPDELLVKIKEAMKQINGNGAKNILIVDDEPDVIDIISTCIEDKGFAIVSASNGVEALEKLKIFMPDVIISDIHMPKMNGFEFLKNLKKDPKFNSIPVIILTGTYLSPEDKLHGLTLGASKYMSKPFSLEILAKEIEEALCRK